MSHASHPPPPQKRTESPSKALPELFTASEIARFCQVDLKTIHNWSEKGQIRHFRTPGRHLRFRRLDVLDFLRTYGYPIPDVLRRDLPKIVVIHRDPSVLASARKALSKRFDVTTFQDPVGALITIGAWQPDVVVLDIEQDGLDGVHLIERLSKLDATAATRSVVYSSRLDRKKEAIENGAIEFVESGDVGGLRQILERLTGLDHG